MYAGVFRTVCYRKKNLCISAKRILNTVILMCKSTFFYLIMKEKRTEKPPLTIKFCTLPPRLTYWSGVVAMTKPGTGCRNVETMYYIVSVPTSPNLCVLRRCSTSSLHCGRQSQNGRCCNQRPFVSDTDIGMIKIAAFT